MSILNKSCYYRIMLKADKWYHLFKPNIKDQISMDIWVAKNVISYQIKILDESLHQVQFIASFICIIFMANCIIGPWNMRCFLYMRVLLIHLIECITLYTLNSMHLIQCISTSSVLNCWNTLLIDLKTDRHSNQQTNIVT